MPGGGGERESVRKGHVDEPRNAIPSGSMLPQHLEEGIIGEQPPFPTDRRPIDLVWS